MMFQCTVASVGSRGQGTSKNVMTTYAAVTVAV